MPRLIFLIGLAAAFIARGFENGEWPPIDKGVWDFNIEDSAPTTATRELCNNPSGWFARYPGKIPLGKSGCRFSSRRLESGAYEVESHCALLDGGSGVARGAVTLENSHAFDAKWEVTENAKPAYRERVRGTWRKVCPSPAPAP